MLGFVKITFDIKDTNKYSIYKVVLPVYLSPQIDQDFSA